MLAFFIPSFFLMLRIHPDYFSYYNPMLGGLSRGMTAIEPKWIIGQKEIVKYFKTVKQENDLQDFAQGESLEEILNTDLIWTKLIVGFPEKYHTQIQPFIIEIGGRATVKDITAQAKRTRYFVYPVWDDTSNEENRFDIELVDQIKLRGVPIYNVYIND